MRLARYLGLAIVAILLIGLAVPYVDANGYRERIESALERALNRKVTAGKVHFNLLTGPGFTVDSVTIYEDPRIGIEPLAYVEALDARVRLTTLWTRRLSFSNLRLKNPTVNLAKAGSGLWNFQLLARDAEAHASASREFPSIQVRSGRINFKFGDYKTIFYLSEADLDVTPLSPDRIDIRFAGQPARTDQAWQNFGQLLGRGIWKRLPGRAAYLDANLEMERSGLSDLARLIEGHTIGIHGLMGARAHISGPMDKLKVVGQLRLEDVHRWDLLPPKSGGWDLKYEGTADLLAQRIELDTSRNQEPAVPFLLRFRASDYLSEPKWGAALEVKDAPVTGFLEVARHMGAQLPEGLMADGKVAGVIGYSRPGGVQGQFAVHNSVLRVQKSAPVEIQSAEFLVDGDRVTVGPSTVQLAEGQTAEVEGSYDSSSGAMDVAVTTRNMSLAELHAGSGQLFGADAIPILGACSQGSWRGMVHYQRSGGEAAWSGSFELRGTRLSVDGLAEPLRIASASVEVDGPKVSITQIKARAGEVAFRADYRHEQGGRPDRMRLEIPEAEIGELERLALPSLRRNNGFLARLQLRRQSAPGWLQTRAIDASVQIDKLTAGDRNWRVEKTRASWSATSVRLLGIEARDGDAEISGQISIDLAGNARRYHFEGSGEDLAYRGGRLTLNGVGDTQGVGPQLLSNARAAGDFSGDGLSLSPEWEFQAIAGSFELTPGARLRLTHIQAAQALESYSGQGATQPDGRMVLELTSGKRQVRVALAK